MGIYDRLVERFLRKVLKPKPRGHTVLANQTFWLRQVEAAGCGRPSRDDGAQVVIQTYRILRLRSPSYCHRHRLRPRVSVSGKMFV